MAVIITINHDEQSSRGEERERERERERDCTRTLNLKDLLRGFGSSLGLVDMLHNDVDFLGGDPKRLNIRMIVRRVLGELAQQQRIFTYERGMSR